MFVKYVVILQTWTLTDLNRSSWKPVSYNKATHKQKLLAWSTQSSTTSGTAYIFNFFSFNLSPEASMSSHSQHRGRGVSHPALMARSALLLTSFLLALLVPKFSLLMGLTGSVTGAALTLILPCVFHLRLQWRQLSVRGRLVDVGILILGVICSVSGVICSLKRLMEGP